MSKNRFLVDGHETSGVVMTEEYNKVHLSKSLDVSGRKVNIYIPVTKWNNPENTGREIQNRNTGTLRISNAF